MTRKKNPSVQLSPKAKDLLDGLADAHHMARSTFLELVLLWLDGLNKTERALILGQIEEDERAAVARILLDKCRSG